VAGSADELRLQGEIVNNSAVVIEDAVLLAPGLTESLGDLEPGQRYPVDLFLQRAEHLSGMNSSLLLPGQAAVFQPNYGATYYDTTIEDIVGTSAYYSNSESSRRYSLLSATLPLYSTSEGGRGAGYFLAGWSRQSPIEVGLGGRRFNTFDTTLHIVQLYPQLPAQNGQRVFPPASFSWAQVSTTDYTSLSPYDGFINLGNTVVFQYMLAQPLPNPKVEELVFHVSLGTQTSLAGLQASLWDFESQVYVPVANLQEGENQISEPQRYVGPGGQILLQLSNTGLGNNTVDINQLDFTLVMEE
jgi:hypothetical protein